MIPGDAAGERRRMTRQVNDDGLEGDGSLGR